MIRPTSNRPPTEGHPADAWDFTALDFGQLWRGREKTTALESDVIGEALEGIPRDRVLEVGLGGGRLTPNLRRKFTEYVGIDITPRFLAERRAADPHPPPYFAADVHRLPFVTGAFRAVVMVRVYNFLVDPRRALGEIDRVLAPGGVVVLSYHPVPSFGTLFDDFRHLLAERRPPGFAPVTFSRTEYLQPRRERVAKTLEDAGLKIDWERVTGLEDNRAGRWIPLPALRSLARLLAPLNLLPHRFVRARTGRGGAGSLPPLPTILACPRCGAPGLSSEFPPTSPPSCRGCGAVFPFQDGIADLR